MTTALGSAASVMSWRAVLAAGPDPRAIGNVVRVAVRVAADIIDDGQATDATPEDLVNARAALAVARPTVAQAQSLRRVVALGADYMATVGYADDLDQDADPDERMAARVLGADGGGLIDMTYRSSLGQDLPPAA